MEDRYSNIQGTIPPTNDVDKTNRYANIQGATPIEEEKKNQEVVPEVDMVGNVVEQTTPQVPTVTEPKQNTVSNIFNQYSSAITSAAANDKTVSNKPERKIDKLFTTPSEFGSKYMPKSKQKEFEQTNPNAVQKSQEQPDKVANTKSDDSQYGDRLDGTEKGKGFYGEITIQDKENKGDVMTEMSVGYKVDGKEVLVPLLNPYTNLDDIENLRGGGQPSEQMFKDAKRWLFYCLANNRSPFATEEEKVEIYTDEDNKIKFKSATDLNNYVVNNFNEIDLEVLRNDPNAFRKYPVGSIQYQEWMEKSVARDMMSEQMEQFSKDTGFEPSAFLDYQEYLINGGTSFDDWKKEYNPQSKIGMDEAAALLLFAAPTLIYDVVFRDGDMIKRIAKGTEEFATGIRTGSVMGDISYITQGLFTLTKDGTYNPFKSAGELKQRDVEWVNRFDRNAKDEVALFMGSIGVDYMPFEIAGNITNKMMQTLTKANASNYYNLMLKSGVMPESAMGITEKIVSSGMQMGGTLGLYSGTQSMLNQMMYSTPEEFMTDGFKTVLNDATSSALTGFVAGVIGGAMGVLTNQIKNKIINDALKNGIIDATKLQKFAYVGTGVAGGTLSTMLEASTFVAMSGEELNTENILKESIKFAMLKFQNPAGLKIDKLQNRTMIDPNFKLENAWTGKYEAKLNEAELDMLGCKDVAEVRELIKKEGLNAVIKEIPTSTAFKLAYSEYGIVVPAKEVDFAPDEVTITSETINGKEYSIVNTYNKQGELTHVSPHENYKDAATEVEFITNKMQEYKVYKAADRLKPEWYAEFNQTANVDKIALNDALQAANPTPEQLTVIKDFNKQVDDFIAKKEKETPIEKPKKKEEVKEDAKEVIPEVKEKDKEEVKTVEPKEETVKLNDKEYTVREEDGNLEVYRKTEQGLLTRETNNDVIKEVKDLSFAKEVSIDVTEKNTVQKEKELREEKEAAGENELNDLVEKKTKEMMKDVEADYDGKITIGGIDFAIKKMFGKGKKLDIFVKNFNGDYIHMEDMEGITPFSKKQMERVRKVALQKFIRENATIVDMTYDKINEYREQQKEIIQKRIDAEISSELSEYRNQRDKLYNEGKNKTENVDIPENIEKHKSNFVGDLKNTKDIEQSLANVRKEKWFKELSGDTQDVVHAMFRDLGEKQLGTIGKQAKMTKVEKSPAGEEVLSIKRSDYLKDLESVSIKGFREKIKAINEVAKDLVSFSKDVRKVLKEAKSNGELSSAKYNTLINKISQSMRDSRKTVDGEKTTITVEQKRKDIIEWVEGALRESAIVKYKSETRGKQKKAKKLLKIAKNSYGEYLSSMKEAIATDISLMDNKQLVKYNEGLESILKAGDRATKKDINDFLETVKDMEIEKIEKNPKEYISTLLSSEIKGIDDYNKAVREFRKATIYAEKMFQAEKITEAERDEILNSLKKGEDSIEVKIKLEGAKIKREHLNSISDQVSEYNQKRQSGEEMELSKPEKELFDEIVTIASNPDVLAKMSIKDAELIDYALKNANEGFLNQFSYQAKDRIKAIYKEIKQTEGLDGVKNSFLPKRKKKQEKSSNKWQDTLDTVQWFRLDQLFKKVGRKLYDGILYDNSVAVGKSTVFQKAVLDPYVKIRDKYFKEIKRKSIFKEKASKIINIKKAIREADTYITIIRAEHNWQTNTRAGIDGKKYEAGQEVPKEIASLFDAVMSREISIGNVTNPENYKTTSDVWAKIKSDPKFFKENGEFDVDYAKSKLSPLGKKYYDTITKTYEQVESYIKAVTEASGREYIPENNYDVVHRIIERNKAGNISEVDLDTFINNASNPIRQTGSVYERKHVPQLIRTDGSRLLLEQIRDIGHNLYVKTEYKSTVDALKSYAKDNPEMANLIDGMQKSIARRLHLDAYGEKLRVDDQAAQWIIRRTSQLVLGVVKRIPQELGANITRNIGSVHTSPKDFIKKTSPVYREMLDGIMSDKNFMSSMGEYLAKGNKSLGVKAIEGVIIAADAYIVPKTFKTEFDREFKRISGKDFDAKAYETDYMYRFKNAEVIRQAKIEGLSRTQELFNTKVSVENPPDIKLFGGNVKKSSAFGQMAYMLQSFGHSDQQQMEKAFLNIKEGFKTGDKRLIKRGFADMLTIPISNYVYMQGGLILGSILREMYDDEFWKTGDFSGVKKGWDEYIDTYVNPATQARSFVTSLAVLAIGKYGLFVPPMAGVIYSFVEKDKDIPDETKEIIAEMSRGAYIKPVNFSSKTYGSVGRSISGLHPVTKEIVNIFDMVEEVAMLTNVGSYSGEGQLDDDDKEYLNFILNAIRYVYPNPISNQLRHMSGNKSSYRTEKEKSGYGGKTTNYDDKTEGYDDSE